MAERDGVPPRLLHRLILRKEFHHRLIGAGDQLAIDRNPDQQRDCAFRRRALVVLGRGAEFVLAFRLAPGLVEAREILLEHQLAVAGDDHGVNVGAGELQPRGDAAQARAVHAGAFRCGGDPAVIKRDG